MADPVHEHCDRFFPSRLIRVRCVLIAGLFAVALHASIVAAYAQGVPWTNPLILSGSQSPESGSTIPATVFLPSPFWGRGAEGEGLAQATSPIPVPGRATPIAEPDTSEIVADTTLSPTDTTTKPPRDFFPPDPISDSSDRALKQLWESPLWPLPPPADLATGDLADGLTFQPAIDVDDAPGPGQFRRYTRWGLSDRVGDWNVDGRSYGWQRLSFPQTAQFDPTILPSFEFQDVNVGERVDLHRSAEWPLDAHSSYFLRQGDYGETYSQGSFRRRFPLALAVDFGFLFYENKGRFGADYRKTRNLRWQAVGPIGGSLFWNLAFTQFQDKSYILTPERFSGLSPHRDDLFYTLEASAYRPADMSLFRAAGLRLQSGKHDIRTLRTYRLESHDQTWTLWGQGIARGWRLRAQGIAEHLTVSAANRSRWGATVDGQRMWPIGAWGSGSLNLAVSGWTTDPIAASAGLAISADRTGHSLVPTLRLERSRLVPTLLDRDRPRVDLSMTGVNSLGLEQYSEEGDRDLDAEWRNSAVFSLATPRDTSDSRLEFVSEAQATYVQRYIRWGDVSFSNTESFYRPVSGDVRTVGVAMALRSPLFWKLHLWLNYAAKYAETLRHERLAGYYPQKGSAIVSWIAPHFRYKIDLRLNAALIWWSGDSRIIPTGYTTAQTYRFDLSGSATMKDFTFYYSLQNVANFPYRTGAGYGFTGRTVRFGFNWNFLN